MFHIPEKHRIKVGPLKSNSEYGNNGAFQFYFNGIQFRVIASDGELWEHVSVSLNVRRTPTWAEMCHVKNLFWDSDDCVVQYHPPKSEYVNNHTYCLHLWRPIGAEIQRPPSYMVGVI